MEAFAQCQQSNEKSMEQILKLAKAYKKSLEDEEKMTEEQVLCFTFPMAPLITGYYSWPSRTSANKTLSAT